MRNVVTLQINMPQEQPQTLFRSAFHFLSGTLLSRVTGLLRDLSMAWCFGSHPALAAFMVAFRFSNLVRRLFGEGQMANGFIPHFETLRASSQEKGALFFRDLFFSLAVFLLLLTLFFEGGLWVWMRGNIGENTAEILQLMMLMMPGVIFICLFGLGSALLQCEGRFFLSGFAPVAFNAVWIGAVWWLKDLTPEQAMPPLAVAICLAFLMQWAVTVPKMVKFFRKSLPLRTFFKPVLFSHELRRVVAPIFFGVVGIGAMQVNSALDAVFARFANLEGPAYLWYAIRIQQFPLALLGVALSSALLPSLSRAAEKGEWGSFLTLLLSSLLKCFALMLPATAVLLILGAPIVNLFYGHGDFSMIATYETLLCLWAYGIGLLPAAGILLLAPAFYAQKNFKTPMRGALYSVLLHLLLNS
ncbi:MAG: murein biosynthesis integral membrane protein MurJ, partial [Chlamydiales bacterium]